MIPDSLDERYAVRRPHREGTGKPPRAPVVGPDVSAPITATHGVRFTEARGRWILLATVLGSGVAFLDGTIVTVALPAIHDDLGASFADLQWVLDAYLLALGALVLVGGALGDLFGRRLVFLIGLVGFGISSVACGLAPDPNTLIAARGAQGVTAALLVPGSLALITASFATEDRGRAIGAWSGLSGVATVLGPFAGGYLIDVASWRWAFLINVPLIAGAIVATVRHVPESAAPEVSGMGVIDRLDLPGAIAAALGLGLVVYPLIERTRLASSTVAALLVAGVVVLAAFLEIERRRRAPMLPLTLFRSRVFSVANILTFAIYGALSGAGFLLTLELQDQLGYSALEAGAATLPMTVLLLFSARVGALLPRTGLRLPLTVGPFAAAVGMLALARVGPGVTYLTGVLPGVLLWSIGLLLIVAPITTAALGAVEESRSGIASGINNAVARVAGLVAIAVLPLAAGLADEPSGQSADFTDGYRNAMVICAALFAGSGVIALVGLPRRGTDTVVAR